MSYTCDDLHYNEFTQETQLAWCNVVARVGPIVCIDYLQVILSNTADSIDNIMSN